MKFKPLFKPVYFQISIHFKVHHFGLQMQTYTKGERYKENTYKRTELV